MFFKILWIVLSCPARMSGMRLCILENDYVDKSVADTYISYGVMVERMLNNVGAYWNIEIFETFKGHFPESYDRFNAVLLTGSRSDAFSTDPWIEQLRNQVVHLLSIQMKLIGICFGHQLIALCLGSHVGRALKGWGLGLMDYQWHSDNDGLSVNQAQKELSLIASHQDQVFDLPKGATLLASSAFCPIAAFSVRDRVFCIQAHPEFVTEYSVYLLDKRRTSLSEEHYTLSRTSLQNPHDGLHVARMMVAFVEGSFG